MLAEVIDVLADPNDGTPLHGDNDFRRLVSESGHSFDVAKQGYVSLLAGVGRKHDGDSAGMIQARETFLAGGHFAPFVEAVTEAMVVARKRHWNLVKIRHQSSSNPARAQDIIYLIASTASPVLAGSD